MTFQRVLVSLQLLIIVLLGLMTTLCFQSCDQKPRPKAVTTIVLPPSFSDTLLLRAEEARNRVIILRKRNNQTVDNYENARVTYDSITVDLP